MFGFKSGPHASGNVDTMIGPGAELKGHLHVKGTVFIDGKLEGDVEADEAILMGEGGQVKGDLLARSVTIGGRVLGDVTATERLELLNTASVKGDLKAPRMVVGEGAYFEGNCSMTPADVPGDKSETKGKKAT
jgi:cytoskeletal protein CcmA (bactofilin family)